MSSQPAPNASAYGQKTRPRLGGLVSCSDLDELWFPHLVFSPVPQKRVKSEPHLGAEAETKQLERLHSRTHGRDGWERTSLL